jgi:hypothetical protein
VDRLRPTSEELGVEGARARQIAGVELQVDDRVVGGVPHLFAAMLASPACGDSMRRVVVTLGCSRCG